MRYLTANLAIVAVCTVLPAVGWTQPADHPSPMYGMGMRQGQSPGGGLYGEGCGMPECGPGMVIEERCRHGMGTFALIRSLDLTPEQRHKLNSIQLDLRKQHWALIGKTIDMRAQLNDLYTADRPDPKKIGQVYSTLFDIKRQIIESQIEAANRAKDILTKEQVEKLTKMKQAAYKGMPYEMMHDMMVSGEEQRK